MKKILFALGLSGVLLNAAAQDSGDPGHITCNYNHLFNEYCAQQGIDPQNDPRFVAYEKEINDFVQNNAGAFSRGTVYVIPIVFHVVHIGGAENISDEQIHDAVRILNRDFRKLNADTLLVDPIFQPIIADVEFEFRLAKKDALGNCVSGITRTFSTTTNVGDDNMADIVQLNLNAGTSSSNLRFPHDQYLNIFVCKDPQGAAGYTNYPMWGAMDPDHDAIWMRHDYTGSIGTSSESHSRALTHEVGHWMNLQHVWGNNNNAGVACGNDGVTDTPETRGWQVCNMTSNDICNPGIKENVQNYMDYSYCCKMFTSGQKARMHAAINSTTAGRNNLWQTSNLTAAGVTGPTTICLADFKADHPVICAGDSIRYSDISYHGVNNWSWSFPSGSPAVSNDQYPVVTYNVPGTYDVSLNVGDGSSTAAANKTAYVTVLDPVGASVPFSENFEAVSSIPNSDWFVSNLNEQAAWELFSGAGSSGTKCIKLDNFFVEESAGKDLFLSQTFDLSSVPTAQIDFKYAYRQRSGGENEKLRVFISNNCGQSWSMKKQIDGTDLSLGMTQSLPFTPGPSDWIAYEPVIIPAAYLNEGFRFRIEFESNGGNNIYIDDINIRLNVGVNEIDPSNLAFNVYPNPVSNQATVAYNLVKAGKVEIKMTDVLGKTITVLENTEKAPGVYQVNFDAGKTASKGVYFVTIRAGELVQSKKVVIE